MNIGNPTEKPTIVVIDDDETQLCIAELFLAADFEVECFSDPHRALTRIFRQPPALILSDIHMPDLDGIALRRRLAANDQTRLIPFVFLSGSRQLQVRRDAMLMAIDDYLEKPIQKTTLLEVINRVLLRARDLAPAISPALDLSITQGLRQPVPAHFGGYSLSDAYRVAGRGGGDAIVWQSTEAGLTLILLDIMGHGEQAKFFAHVIAGFFHGLFAAFPHEDSPAKRLQRLSDLMATHDLLAGTLLTCQILQISSSGELCIASAGHPKPLLMHHQQAPQELDVGGSLPGLGLQNTYDEIRVNLQPGEHLLLHTDGLFENAPASEHAQFRRSMLQHMQQSIAFNRCDANTVMQGFDTIAPGLPRDDATVVIIKKT